MPVSGGVFALVKKRIRLSKFPRPQISGLSAHHPRTPRDPHRARPAAPCIRSTSCSERKVLTPYLQVAGKHYSAPGIGRGQHWSRRPVPEHCATPHHPVDRQASRAGSAGFAGQAAAIPAPCLNSIDGFMAVSLGEVERRREESGEGRRTLWRGFLLPPRLPLILLRLSTLSNPCSGVVPFFSVCRESRRDPLFLLVAQSTFFFFLQEFLNAADIT